MTRGGPTGSGPVTLYDAQGRAIPGADVRALRRMQVQALSRFLGTGGYSGARSDKRSLKKWHPGVGSADSDSIPDLPSLRARSRDLERNAPFATGAINTAAGSIVGTGLRLSAKPNRRVLGLSEEAAQAWKERTELLWQLWSRQADVTGHEHFAGLQELVLRSELVSGDLFVLRRFVERRGDLLGLRLQTVEADRVATPPGEGGAGSRVVEGVERNRDGRPLGYWVRSVHPGDRMERRRDEFMRVPARSSTTGRARVLHIFERRRPGQTRGVPYLAPVIEPLKQLERYSEAELSAAVIASFFTVFIKSEGGASQGLANVKDDNDPDTPDSGDAHRDAPDVNLGPAAVMNLEKGEDISTANPGRPNEKFEPFVRAILEQVGVSLELPFELVVKHFTASYSASRAALLEAWRFFKRRRQHLVRQLCEPVYGWFLEECVLRGLIEAPGFLDDPVARHAWLGADWTGPAMGQVDPTKETKAAAQRIAIGASTHTQAAAELTGTDFQGNVEELGRETAQLREAGVAAPTAAEDEEDRAVSETEP